ncbi:MAG TPA: glycosyltransferase family 4 protein [Burkholderiales bacterium]|nr:glycosyltransferase family 4 protein [Burkholderiales bacterium]
MKILYHHRTRSKDGQYVHISELIHALRKLGHEVLVVAPSAMEHAEFGSDAGVVALLKRFVPRFAYELMELAYSLLAYRRLKRAVVGFRPDCLYERYNLLLPAGVWIKRNFGLPMLLEVNAPIFEERARYDGISLKRLAAWSQRYAWRNADFVLPVTRVLAGMVRDAGVPGERIAVIPNGIDPDRFGNNSLPAEVAKAKLGLRDRLVLGFTGFVREWHGLERVIDLVADRAGGPGLHLLVVGDGPAREALQARARERGIVDRVTLTGVIDRDRVPGYVAAFDVALQPAVVPYASPLKLFEYLAMGRAIVAPATPNIEEILTDGENAVLFDPEEPDAMLRAIERICADGGLRRRVAEGARNTIALKKLTWDNNARRVAELFERLLRRPPAAAQRGAPQA